MKLPKIYEPGQYETDIYALWEKSKAFAPTGEGKRFSIVVPPPNANGNLHIGHALTLGLEDIAIRYHRLKGDQALLLPGADHAGFETQVVYEKQLAKEGKSRFDFSREELYKQIWDFVAQNRENFEGQIRRLGASVDWNHYTFTIDEKIVKRAYATFKKMWEEGLIYRGKRIVNFCTFHGTSFADIEVAHKGEKGKLYYIAFPLADKSGEVVVATARPETVVGQAGLMVNPEDKRYKHLIGAIVNQPLIPDAPIKIVASDKVDSTFGTGIVTITPGHSAVDYEVAHEHGLPVVELITHEGKLSGAVPQAFRGLTVKEARHVVAEALDKAGHLRKVEDYTHTIGVCYKCGTVIEPLLREQWFVDMQPLANRATSSLRAGEIAFYPESKKDQLINYLENLRDWNISRQIAWGIPIPAFQNVDDPDDWIYDERIGQEIIEVDDKTYRRDPDVFDTWFSSSSWPYATLDFPDSEDFKDFYPLSLMETGGEILYPWVSRMIMLGLYVTDEIPFKAVYIHGYVMAEDGTKMSKSIGNVINPLEVIDKYGSDALRMGIIASRVPAVNRGYDHRKVEDARNFCNKLWNIARYVEDKVGDRTKVGELEPKTTADHWVLNKLQQTTEVISANLDNYRFAEAYDALYHFVWDDFADWYIEASKAEPNLPLLAFCLESILKLAHPFAPFLTETIWQTLAWEGNSLLATNRWPEIPGADKKLDGQFEAVKTIVAEVRFIVKAIGVRDANLKFADEPLLSENAELIKQLAHIKGVTEATEQNGVMLTQSPYKAWLEIDEKAIQKYLDELAAKRDAAETTIGQLKARLMNKSYVENAPKHIVDQTKQNLAEAETLLANIEQEQKRFTAGNR
ncbi:MAG TPA: valine--tRNA ligase [Candidatus Saccharimonadales bacterium]|jgi:valyl-tRNA synthetase